jgi:hypothetical protein
MKTHHGTTEMLRGSIICLAVVFFIVFGVSVYKDESSEYWQAVGPRWDKMYNPVNYND